MSKEPYSPEFQKLFDSYPSKFQATLKKWSETFDTTKEFEEWWEKVRYKGPENENIIRLNVKSMGPLKIAPKESTS